MRIKGLLAFCSTLLLFSCYAFAAEKVALVGGGAKDLSAWQTGYTHWALENGVLILKDRTDGKEHNDNYLWTKDQYENFVLDFEFFVDPSANSGVFIRTSDLNDPVYSGLEIQVGIADPSRPIRKNSMGAIYDLVAPSGHAMKIGEWNQMRIRCEGSRVQVDVNGKRLSEADLSQWVVAGQSPDGTKNKFKRPIAEYAHKGYIGLQDHGTPVQFRNMVLTRLP